MMNDVTLKEVAAWMLHQIDEFGCLYQEEAVHNISTTFGGTFTTFNNAGNLAINKDVLKEFRKLTVDDVVWDRSEKAWRKRCLYDPEALRQVN